MGCRARTSATATLIGRRQSTSWSLLEKPHNCLLELRQCGGSCNDTAPEPESDAQTEATPISNHHEIFDLIDNPFAALAVTVKRMVDFFDITTESAQVESPWGTPPPGYSRASRAASEFRVFPQASLAVIRSKLAARIIFFARQS